MAAVNVNISLSATASRDRQNVCRGGRHHQYVETSSRCGTDTCQQVVPLCHPHLTPSGPAQDGPSPLQVLSTTSWLSSFHAATANTQHTELQEMNRECLNIVFDAIVTQKSLYATSVWSGFVSINAFMQELFKKAYK